MKGWNTRTGAGEGRCAALPLLAGLGYGRGRGWWLSYYLAALGALFVAEREGSAPNVVSAGGQQNTGCAFFTVGLLFLLRNVSRLLLYAQP